MVILGGWAITELALLFKVEILVGKFFGGCWRIHQNIPPPKFCAIQYVAVVACYTQNG